MELERIATNTYDFENVRRNRYVYVDKTGILYPLVNGSIGNQFFLSRPRRFGKSLLISTIQKLFEGRRDLFEGLAIDSLPWDWSQTYPVLRLDMNGCSGETVEEVEASVAVALGQEARRPGGSACRSTRTRPCATDSGCSSRTSPPRAPRARSSFL